MARIYNVEQHMEEAAALKAYNDLEATLMERVAKSSGGVIDISQGELGVISNALAYPTSGMSRREEFGLYDYLFIGSGNLRY